MVGRGQWDQRSGSQLALWFEITELIRGLHRVTSLNNLLWMAITNGLATNLSVSHFRALGLAD